MDIERRDRAVHPDGNEEVEVTPYNKVFLGDVSSTGVVIGRGCEWQGLMRVAGVVSGLAAGGWPGFKQLQPVM